MNIADDSKIDFVLPLLIHCAIMTLKGGESMAQKSANVIARIEPEIKEQAESILAEMGISASLGINMFYHQIINVRGLPFAPTTRTYRSKSLEEMSDEEFDERIAAGLSQAQEDMGSTVAETFARLRTRNKNEREAI